MVMLPIPVFVRTNIIIMVMKNYVHPVIIHVLLAPNKHSVKHVMLKKIEN